LVGATLGLLLQVSPALAEGEASSAESASGDALPTDPAAAGEASEDGSAEPTEEQVAEARLHFSNGVTLLEATPPNYQDAYRQFSLAYEKSGHNWKVLGNLGLCALSLERDGEALGYYRDYLDQGGDEVSAEERAAIERELLLIKGNMATLTLTSALPETKVTVTRQGSSVPSQRYEFEGETAQLGLRAGELTLLATSGDKEEVWSVVVAPEEEVTHNFAFAPPEEAEPVAPVEPPPAVAEEPRSSANPVRTAGFITGGVGIATIIGGVIAGALSQSQADQARNDGCIGTVCRESVESDLDAASDLATVANILMVGGGVLTATGVTLVVIGSKKSSERPSAALEMTPVLGAGFAGLSARGSF
jgi:hypothetical protein